MKGLIQKREEDHGGRQSEQDASRNPPRGPDSTSNGGIHDILSLTAGTERHHVRSTHANRPT